MHYVRGVKKVSLGGFTCLDCIISLLMHSSMRPYAFVCVSSVRMRIMGVSLHKRLFSLESGFSLEAVQPGRQA